MIQQGKSGYEHPMVESEELLTDMKFKEKRVSGSVCNFALAGMPCFVKKVLKLIEFSLNKNLVTLQL